MGRNVGAVRKEEGGEKKELCEKVAVDEVGGGDFEESDYETTHSEIACGFPS